MAPEPDEGALRLSLLDRLLDDDPDKETEAPQRPEQVYRQLMESIRRDLTDLLNSRERCVSWPRSLEELNVSLLAYGTPDVTGASLSTAEDRDAFLKNLAAVIRRCDQRFKSVRVVSVDKKDATDRTLRFRIETVFRIESDSETLTFDFRLDPISRTFQS